MTREEVIKMLKIAVSIALIVLAIKFFVKFLPYIILLLVLILLYDSYKHRRIKKKNNDIKEAIVIEEKVDEK